MRILIVGSGGREHALAWKLRQSPKVNALFIAPGNAGTCLEGENVPIPVDDVAGLVAFAKDNSIDLVVPGPELPLTLGITDAMQAAGIPCFGPSKWCAQLEGSKSFSKDIMRAAGVPTAGSHVFESVQEAADYVREAMRKSNMPLVIKADGLASGKGVVVASSRGEALAALVHIMTDRAFGDAGNRVVVEEFLAGEEVSLLAFCDGTTALPLPSAQDHKAAFDNDTGPNTGGMGAYSPAPALLDSDLEAMTDLTIRPILAEVARQGHPFVGILYAGLMMTADGPKVLEYNTRFGDPECQPLLMRLGTDLTEIIVACVEGRLAEQKVVIRPEPALGVVLAADGYPGSHSTDMRIEGLEAAEANGAKIFHAGTKLVDGYPVASGGRILCATAFGATIAEAQKNAYAAIHHVHMEKGRFRLDIGWKAIKREKNRNEG